MKINGPNIAHAFLLSTLLVATPASGQELERRSQEEIDWVQENIIEPHYEEDSDPDPEVENTERDTIEEWQRWQRGEEPQPE